MLVNVLVLRKERSTAEQRMAIGLRERSVQSQDASLMTSKKSLCLLLREAVIDEKKASKKDYPKLIKVSKGSKVPARFKKDIGKIIKDESKHHGIIDGYYRYVCGRQR